MKAKIKTYFTLIALIFTSLLLLNGCNTVQGVGKDITQAGKVIQGAASGNKSTSQKTTTVKTSSPTTTQTTSTQTTVTSQ